MLQQENITGLLNIKLVGILSDQRRPTEKSVTEVHLVLYLIRSYCEAATRYWALHLQA